MRPSSCPSDKLPRSDHYDLTKELRDAAPGMAHIVAMNRGSLTQRIIRLAAVSYSEDLKADGYDVIDSAGPCALGMKALGTDERTGLGAGFQFTMVGPTGVHHVHVSAKEAGVAGELFGDWSPRPIVHWYGFIEMNGVDVMKGREEEQRGRWEELQDELHRRDGRPELARLPLPRIGEIDA